MLNIQKLKDQKMLLKNKVVKKRKHRKLVYTSRSKSTINNKFVNIME